MNLGCKRLIPAKAAKYFRGIANVAQYFAIVSLVFPLRTLILSVWCLHRVERQCWVFIHGSYISEGKNTLFLYKCTHFILKCAQLKTTDQPRHSFLPRKFISKGRMFVGNIEYRSVTSSLCKRFHLNLKTSS